jgi:hypothetical protein
MWAFGVLCWEITTHAKTPYGVFGVRDMMESLVAGNRLDPGLLAPPGQLPLFCSLFVLSWLLLQASYLSFRRMPFVAIPFEI